jgi:hypothetical protein
MNSTLCICEKVLRYYYGTRDQKSQVAGAFISKTFSPNTKKKTAFRALCRKTVFFI